MPFETIAPAGPAPAAPAAPASAPLAPAAPAPAAPAAPPAPATGSTPEGLDLSGLPEQFRPQAETLYKQVTEKHRSELTKHQEASKAFQEKAMALDKLIADQDFQRFWFDKNNPRPQAAQPKAPEAPVVSPEEWQSAYDKALSGDMAAMNSLTERQLESLVQQKYAPVMQQMATKQREIELNMEMTDLFTNHPDAKDFDRAGLLEPVLHLYTDKLGKPMEVAYQEAKKAYDYILNKAKQDLTAQAQEKKASITETPATTTADANVVFVDTPQQALRQQLMATMKGLKVTYKVRPRQK